MFVFYGAHHVFDQRSDFEADPTPGQLALLSANLWAPAESRRLNRGEGTHGRARI